MLDQIEFLLKRVIKDDCIGYIHGPPGSGKTFTSFLFAISQLDTFAVTWVHLNVVNKADIIQFIDSSKKILVKSDFISEHVPNAQDLNVIFQSLHQTKSNIIFVDGLRGDDKHNDFQLVLNGAVAESNKSSFRIHLVYVSSMASGGKIPLPEMKSKGLAVFEVDSWSLEEYKNCVSNPEFMKEVRPVLDSAIMTTTKLTDEDLLLSKYYFAGSCCRYTGCPRKNAIYQMLFPFKSIAFFRGHPVCFAMILLR